MNSYTDPSQHFFWLASRSLGVVAVVLLAASVTIGLALSGRIIRRPGIPARLKGWHEAIALTATAAIAGHGLLLLGDGFLHASLRDITVPFAMAGQPVWTGIGIIGGWLTAVFTFSFYVRRWIGTKAWRWLHRWTLAAYLLAVVHTIGSGTDARSPWLIATVLAVTAPIVFAATYRFLPADRPARRAPARGTSAREASALAVVTGEGRPSGS
jgi:sulfoxide reductase heme-binding subunit YedZ